MSKLVCQCASIYSSEVEHAIKAFPHLDASGIKDILNIGKGCGICQMTESVGETKSTLTVEEIIAKK